MNFKDIIVFSILVSLAVLFSVMFVKTSNKKNNNNRIIEQIDPDYDDKYQKRNWYEKIPINNTSIIM